MEKYTDQAFFYKQTPVNYDGIAKFTSIKGNTLGWNQLVQNGNFADSSNWYARQSTYTVSDNIATVTPSTEGTERGMYCLAFPVKANHKYLLSCEIKPPIQSTARVSFGGAINYGFDVAIQVNQWNKCQGIVLNDTDRNIGFFSLIRNSLTPSQTIQFRNMMVVDLTQMGLDISSPSEFTSLFPLPFYDFNQGTLIPFSGNGIKTVGFNQWDEEWESGIYNAATGDKQSGTRVRSKNFIKVLPNTPYYMTIACNRYYYDGDFNYIGYKSVFAENIADTTPPNCAYMTFNTFDAYGQTYKNDIAVSLENGTYEPYTSSAISLPISTYFPTGMKRAGNVYDELTENKAITRVGAVDLGSLDWVYQSGNTRFNANQALASLAKLPSTNNEVANIICAKYGTTSSNNTASASYNLSVGLSTFGNIQIRDTNFTDATAFKESLQGVYLSYELATETETDAEDIFYKFYADGTEQLLPVNGASPTTAPIIADIEYYDSTEGDSLYRRFWLINGDGERWDLTDKEFKSFLNNPTGLGFRKTIEVTRYGEKANKNNEVYDFPQPSGELLFYDTYNSTRYDKYNKFIRFLMSQPITLYYMIPVSYISGIANIFTLNCDVTEVQKTESKTDHILTSSIVFNGLGFYEGDEISVNGTTDTYTLTNEGDFPVGFEITVEGSLTKPYITLSQDGELYGEAKFVGTQSYNSLYVNSNDGEQNIILQQGGSVIPNPLSYQDLSISNGSIYVTFVKLAKGVSELSIGVESGSISNVNIKYSPKYRSV